MKTLAKNITSLTLNIFQAIESCNEELLSKLLRSGTDVNIHDDFGQTPLHIAIDIAFEEAIYNSETKRKTIQPKLNIIKILLENGADPLLKDNNNKSPLDWAKQRNDINFMLDLNELVTLLN